MRLFELLTLAGYTYPSAFLNVEVLGISSDSRTLRQGEIFVAVRGLHSDGNDFCDVAKHKGAVLIVSEQEVEGGLRVPNARAALARLWSAWYRHPGKEMTLIGVTGTNGKTSTSTMLFDLLCRCQYRCGLIGTVECRLGESALKLVGQDPLANMTTPEPQELYAMLAAMRDGGATHVVMEVSSHALVLERTAPLRFKRAIFTNLTPEHLDFHGDMAAYYQAKRRLFAQADGAVVSCLGAYGKRLADELEMPLWRLDESILQDVALCGREGVRFTLCGEKVFLPVPGSFSVENGALALLTAVTLGVDPATARCALADFSGVRGRMERIGDGRSAPTILIDYAHTPDALEKLLRTVRGCSDPGDRITVLFGCGGDRDPSKRREMGRIASALADHVILTSDNCRSERAEDILRDILRGVDKEKSYKVIPDRAEAIRYAVQTARVGEVLILAGKGHEDYEIRGDQRLYFSEKEIALAALKEREAFDAH